MCTRVPKTWFGFGFLAFVVASILAYAATVSGNTCIAEPVKVSGRFCGRVFDPTGAAVPNAQLELVEETEKQSVVAETRADADGDFAFPRVAAGKYRLTSPGWFIDGEVQITGRGGAACRRPLSVTLGTMGCQGGISTRRAQHFREPGVH
jgi:hypothetical protein